MHSKDLMSRGANEIKNKTSKTTLYVHMEPNFNRPRPSKHQTLQGLTFK